MLVSSLVVSAMGWRIRLGYDAFDGLFEVISRGWHSLERANVACLHAFLHPHDGIAHEFDDWVVFLGGKILSRFKDVHYYEAPRSLC